MSPIRGLEKRDTIRIVDLEKPLAIDKILCGKDPRPLFQVNIFKPGFVH
jgi:hypothetical protein